MLRVTCSRVEHGLILDGVFGTDLVLPVEGNISEGVTVGHVVVAVTNFAFQWTRRR